MSAQAVPAVFGMGEGTLSIDRDAFHGPIRTGVLQRLRAAVPHERQGVIVLQGGEAQPVYSTDGEVLFRQVRHGWTSVGKSAMEVACQLAAVPPHRSPSLSAPMQPHAAIHT
jgi:hypothetical protein